MNWERPKVYHCDGCAKEEPGCFGAAATGGVTCAPPGWRFYVAEMPKPSGHGRFQKYDGGRVLWVCSEACEKLAEEKEAQRKLSL